MRVQQALFLLLSEYFECCNYICCVGARRVAMGATSGICRTGADIVRCKGGHFREPVHRPGDEQVIYLYEWNKRYLKEVQSRFLKETTHFEITSAGAL